MANYADTVCEILKEPTGVYVLASCDVHSFSHCMLCILKIITLESLNACEYTHTRERYPCTNVQATVTTADHTLTHTYKYTHTAGATTTVTPPDQTGVEWQQVAQRKSK